MGLKEWGQTFGGFAVRLFGHLVDLFVGDLQENLSQQRLGQDHLQLDRWEGRREGGRKGEGEREEEGESIK